MIDDDHSWLDEYVEAVAQRDAARALCARAAATIREHLAALPKCEMCSQPGTRRLFSEIWCDAHRPGFQTREVKGAKTVRELQALLAEIEAPK